MCQRLKPTQFFIIIHYYHFFNFIFRSSRLNQKGGPDECSTDDTEDQPNPDSEKSSKHKIRTRTSSRNSPALLDSPKVVCDVSEDNPTRIKIHIGNKSPDKAPPVSPVLPSKEKPGETEAAVSCSQVVVKETISDVDVGNEEKEIDEEKKIEEKVEQEENPVDKIAEVNATKETSEEQLPNSELNAEHEQDSTIVLETSEIITESNNEVPETTVEVEKGNDETPLNKAAKDEPVQRSNSSHSPSPR